ncbi:MAG TPA: ABC transporter ATP-binding protein [Syntrophorhabdaceae bacterium]|nr:ABC transporter ATP-binding protein [Syntrophorhabdaceae bacterium]
MSVDPVSSEHLHFQYNGIEILTDISFQIRTGDYVGVVGPNGSGKTTLIKIVLGFLKPTKGKISLFGQAPQDFNNWEKVGYLPQKAQDFNPHFPATVREIVSLGLLSKKGFPKRIGQRDDEAVNDVLSLMDITNIQEKLIGELSGGQQQRVLIAKAMVAGPELLILDEPTTALDPEARETFFNTLTELNDKKKITIIMITHDIGTIGKHATELLYLDKQVIFYGTFDTFCASHEMASYFGEYSQHVICHRHD